MSSCRRDAFDAVLAIVALTSSFCSTLGTPSSFNWPGVEKLPQYADTFPRWPPSPWPKILPGVDPVAVDLISVNHLCDDSVVGCRKWDVYVWFVSQQMLRLEPLHRITARDALDHPFFKVSA